MEVLTNALTYIITLLARFQKITFAWFFSWLTVVLNRRFRPEKEHVFRHLNDRIRNHSGPKKLQILEIGGGSGSNFEFVDGSVSWTITEPNLCFAPYFNKVRAKFASKHDISDLVEAKAESLGQFETDSMDAVICTLVLCTVTNVKEALSEVKRVLKPGGTLYLVEHVLAPPEETGLRRVQTFLTRTNIWPILFDHCCLDRDNAAAIKDAGFSNVDLSLVSKPIMLFGRNVSPMKYLSYGWASK